MCGDGKEGPSKQRCKRDDLPGTEKKQKTAVRSGAHGEMI